MPNINKNLTSPAKPKEKHQGRGGPTALEPGVPPNAPSLSRLGQVHLSLDRKLRMSFKLIHWSSDPLSGVLGWSLFFSGPVPKNKNTQQSIDHPHLSELLHVSGHIALQELPGMTVETEPLPHRSQVDRSVGPIGGSGPSNNVWPLVRSLRRVHKRLGTTIASLPFCSPSASGVHGRLLFLSRSLHLVRLRGGVPP